MWGCRQLGTNADASVCLRTSRSGVDSAAHFMHVSAAPRLVISCGGFIRSSTHPLTHSLIHSIPLLFKVANKPKEEQQHILFPKPTLQHSNISTTHISIHLYKILPSATILSNKHIHKEIERKTMRMSINICRYKIKQKQHKTFFYFFIHRGPTSGARRDQVDEPRRVFPSTGRGRGRGRMVGSATERPTRHSDPNPSRPDL